MKNTITITSKGQTTIPNDIRKKLGVHSKGAILNFRYDESKGELIIAKSIDIDELSNKVSSYIKPNTVPLKNVDEYYQKNR